MFIDCLQRHLSVCAQKDLPHFVKFEPNFWNVISMRGPTAPLINKRGFVKVWDVICDDVVGLKGLAKEHGMCIPRREHVKDIFSFVDSIPGKPLLVHCMAGMSRSTAIALAVIVREMLADGFATEEIVQTAPDILLKIRPISAPNPLILELAFKLLLSEAEAVDLMRDLLNHPVLFANRHGGASPEA